MERIKKEWTTVIVEVKTIDEDIITTSGGIDLPEVPTH